MAGVVFLPTLERDLNFALSFSLPMLYLYVAPSGTCLAVMPGIL